jgi:hypothetical protein
MIAGIGLRPSAAGADQQIPPAELEATYYHPTSQMPMAA